LCDIISVSEYHLQYVGFIALIFVILQLLVSIIFTVYGLLF